MQTYAKIAIFDCYPIPYSFLQKNLILYIYPPV